MIKSEGSTIAIEYINEKRDTFCDTNKQERGRGTRNKQKKKQKEKRERPVDENYFHPERKRRQKKHTREHFNCDLYMIND